MSGLQFSPDGASLTVSNPSATRAQDALTIDVMVNGQRRYFWTAINLPSGASKFFIVRFLQPVDSPVVVLCGDHPVGIVESPDPVLGITVVPLPDPRE